MIQSPPLVRPSYTSSPTLLKCSAITEADATSLQLCSEVGTLHVGQSCGCKSFCADTSLTTWPLTQIRRLIVSTGESIGTPGMTSPLAVSISACHQPTVDRAVC